MCEPLGGVGVVPAASRGQSRGKEATLANQQLSVPSQVDLWGPWGLGGLVKGLVFPAQASLSLSLSADYTVRPIVPAEKGELLAVAKAMHRDNFGRNVKELFHLEREAALKSMETGEEAP